MAARLDMSLDDIVKEERYSKLSPKKRAAAIAKDEKRKLKQEQKAEHDEKVAVQKQATQEILSRTVNVVVDLAEKYDWIQTKLSKYGEVEKFKGGMRSVFEVKFATVEGAEAAKAANFKISVPVVVHAKKNKWRTVYFPFAEGMSEEADDDLLEVVREVFSEKGEVVDVYYKQQKKWIFVEFDSNATRDAVVAAPRCEINGVTVYAVFAGMPNARKLAQQAKKARKAQAQRPQNGSAKKRKGNNAAFSSFDGQPPSLN